MTAIGRGARSFLKAVRRVVPTPPAPARAALESAPRADVAQLVERRFPKPKVAGSKPVVRFRTFPRQAAFPLLVRPDPQQLTNVGGGRLGLMRDGGRQAGDDRGW